MQVKYFLTLSISVTNDKGKVSEISHCSLTTLKYLLNYIKAVVPLNCGVQKSHFLPLLLAYYYSCHTTQSNGPRERKNRARSRKRKKVNSTGRVIARCEHGLIINWIGCYTSFILFFSLTRNSFWPLVDFLLLVLLQWCVSEKTCSSNMKDTKDQAKFAIVTWITLRSLE